MSGLVDTSEDIPEWAAWDFRQIQGEIAARALMRAIALNAEREFTERRYEYMRGLFRGFGSGALPLPPPPEESVVVEPIYLGVAGYR